MSVKKSTSRSTQSSSSLGARPIGSIKRNVSMAIYGRSGTGKTTFAATAPGPILYLDIKDEGTDSISDVKNIDVKEIHEFADFEDTYWWLVKNPKKYKTIIIDTLTMLQTMAVEEVMASKKSKSKKRVGDWGSMDRRDWGDVAALLKEWIINYRDLTQEGMQIVFIAQDRTFNLNEEEEANESMLAPEIGPALSPSVVKTLNAGVSVLANTFIRERVITKEVNGKKVKKTKIEYCLGVGPSSLYTRKIRKPKSIDVPDVLVNPEWDDVVSIIQGEA